MTNYINAMVTIFGKDYPQVCAISQIKIHKINVEVARAYCIPPKNRLVIEPVCADKPKVEILCYIAKMDSPLCHVYVYDDQGIRVIGYIHFMKKGPK